MNSQKNQKPPQKKSNASMGQKLKTDLEKKLHSENAKVFQQIFGVKALKKKA